MSDLPDIPEPEGGQTPFGEVKPPGRQVTIPWRLVAALTLFGLIVIFALQNTRSVDVSFLFWDFGIPLIVVIVGTMTVAVVFGDLLDMWWKRRKRKHRDGA